MRQLRKPFQHTQTLVIAEVREQIQEDIICYVEAVGGEEENRSRKIENRSSV